MKEQANYGNWVPEKALYLLFGGAAILLVVAVGGANCFRKACDYRASGRGRRAGVDRGNLHVCLP
ncbi:hypothetical protein KGMB01110_23720 [Mediterraneibacter butyricigenes]|uniref:Uncharacterized protein n=1 Tax=Mediterraneibacter butyricigenes TaxID=2316025 RepID=A0A391P6L0_9FIRM|nr:hypothetical protein [Mediterraneibacter butyricigenes]GCA67936.1 hypothetical protein KGMB01110_23720 [Mediterraneibacter butyricigenes]